MMHFNSMQEAQEWGKNNIKNVNCNKITIGSYPHDRNFILCRDDRERDKEARDLAFLAIQSFIYSYLPDVDLEENKEHWIIDEARDKIIEAFQELTGYKFLDVYEEY